MADVGLTVTGFEELNNFLSNVAPDAIKGGAANAVNELADEIYNTTTELCPVDTGALRGSISVNVTSSGDGGQQLTAAAGMDYASYVDEGTSKMAAEPFFSDPINKLLADFDSKIIHMITLSLSKEGVR